MSHLFGAAISKLGTGSNLDASTSPPPESRSHQSGTFAPVSPRHTGDEDIELDVPKAAVQLQGRRGSAFSQASQDSYGTPGLQDARETAVPPSWIALNEVSAGGRQDSVAPFEISRQVSLGGASFAVPPRSSEDADPLLLRSRMVDESDLRRRTSGKGRRADRDMKRFYSDQNTHIERLLKPMHAHSQEGRDAQAGNALKVRIAVYGSLAANCVLAILQLYAAVSSLSLSLFATAADSVFDPFANFALNYLHRKSERVDERKWPTGGSRFENVGNCVYAFLMGTVSVVLIVESIRDVASHSSDSSTNDLNVPSLVAVGVAFCVKLSLFAYCWALRRFNSQVQVLWEDHRNDLGINGLGIVTSALGSKIAWWIDPAGAMLISTIIIISWSLTASHNFSQLAGRGAHPEFLQLVTYKCMLFSNLIEKIDSCKAYHTGPKYTVEVDIVMAPDTPLWKAHDVAQALQDSLEDLPEVDRAFCHVDHEISHAPEHRKSK
ncbi:unnamed protein product [Jaminaea pallidilutea]